MTQYSIISARPGDTVILPCKFNVFQNVNNIVSVVWQKTTLEVIASVDLANNPENGEAIHDHKYKNRTQIHQDWLRTGHPNLTIYNVSTADLGNYTCYINTKSWTHRCADVHITLAVQETDTSHKGDNVTKGDQETNRFAISEQSKIMMVIASLYVCIAIGIIAFCQRQQR